MENVQTPKPVILPSTLKLFPSIILQSSFTQALKNNPMRILSKIQKEIIALSHSNAHPLVYSGVCMW
jgi:hypothetical protein